MHISKQFLAFFADWHHTAAGVQGSQDYVQRNLLHSAAFGSGVGAFDWQDAPTFRKEPRCRFGFSCFFLQSFIIIFILMQEPVNILKNYRIENIEEIINLLRLACARNLSRAVIIENTVLGWIHNTYLLLIILCLFVFIIFFHQLISGSMISSIFRI